MDNKERAQATFEEIQKRKKARETDIQNYEISRMYKSKYKKTSISKFYKK